LRRRATRGLQNTGERVSQGFNALRDRASNGIDNLRTRASNGIDNLRDRASNGWNNLRDRFSNMKEQTVNGFNNLRDRATNGFRNLEQKAVTGLENLGNRATVGLQNGVEKAAANLARFEKWAGNKFNVWGDRAKQIAQGMTPQNVANLAMDLNSLRTGRPNPNRMQNERIASQMTRPNLNAHDQQLTAYAATRIAYDKNAGGFNPARVPGFQGWKQDVVSIQREGHARLHMLSNPNTRESIIAVRGTDPKLGDWAYNGKSLPVPDRVFPTGNVHLGLRQKDPWQMVTKLH
jgi:hypothetical protein